VKHAALYTKEEMELILQLPKKEYILEKFQTSAALVGLIDILYACLYDTRWELIIITCNCSNKYMCVWLRMYNRILCN